MTWYAAHIVQYWKFLDGNQDSYPLYENIVLIEANDTDAAWEKAKQIGDNVYNDNEGSSTATYNDRPAALVFAGIRKLVECENMSSEGLDRADAGFRPTHGTEITYSEMEVDSRDALDKLLKGEQVSVMYQD